MMFDPNKHHRRSIRLENYDYSQPGAYFVTICTQKRACLFGDVVDDHMMLSDGGQMIEHWWMELPNKYPTVQIDAHVVMPNHFHGIIVIIGADPRVCPDGDGENQTDQQQGAHINQNQQNQQQGAHINQNQQNQQQGAHINQNQQNQQQGAHVNQNQQNQQQGAHVNQNQQNQQQGAHINQNQQNQQQGAHVGAPLPTIVQWFKTMTTNSYIRGVKQNGWSPFMGKLWQRNYYEHIVRNDHEMNAIRTYIHNNPRNWTLDNNRL